jgi:hypothetical protein
VPQNWKKTLHAVSDLISISLLLGFGITILFNLLQGFGWCFPISRVSNRPAIQLQECHYQEYDYHDSYYDANEEDEDEHLDADDYWSKPKQANNLLANQTRFITRCNWQIYSLLGRLHHQIMVIGTKA